jgi:hypothetical protein
VIDCQSVNLALRGDEPILRTYPKGDRPVFNPIGAFKEDMDMSCSISRRLARAYAALDRLSKGGKATAHEKALMKELFTWGSPLYREANPWFFEPEAQLPAIQFDELPF